MAYKGITEYAKTKQNKNPRTNLAIGMRIRNALTHQDAMLMY
jgi:hypothetical protein